MPGSGLDQPLLSSPATTTAAAVGPRILDRDGNFSQSRGRWSVANTSSTAASSGRGSGSARQRRAAADTVAATITASDSTIANDTDNGINGAAPFGVTGTSPLSCCLLGAKRNDRPGRLCWDNWFHSLSYMPTCVLMMGVFAAYFVTILIFAGLYLAVNKIGERMYTGGHGSATAFEAGGSEPGESFCGMDINNHMEALYFSLSTMATIGYGTSDYYFGECWTPFVVVLLQVFSAIVFSSLAIGLLFQRMSRGQKRGRTIVFSDVAVVRKVRGRWYWMFRVAELRNQHIIGAKLKVFCVRHERCPVATSGGVDGGNNTVDIETAHFVSHPLPVLNGSTGEEGTVSECVFEQSIIMGIPHVVVHRMDSSSPMMPPRPTWYDAGGVPHGSAGGTSDTNAAASSLLATTMEEGQAGSEPTQEEITNFLQDRQAEIIVFLEGTCEVTGLALQARHSYRMEDIAFHQTFAPCVFPARANATENRQSWWNPFTKNTSKAKVDEESKSYSGEETHDAQGASSALEIDFCQFHQLLPAPYDAISCPYIPPSSMRRP